MEIPMDIMDAIRARRSVRQYTDDFIDPVLVNELQKVIDLCNAKSGLNIQLIVDEPAAFDGFLARYGWLTGVTDYIAMVGKKTPEAEEACGYYGEHIVLRAQQLGLNTCWVGGTYKKAKTDFWAAEDEKLHLVIALGYGKNQGIPRRSKGFDAVADARGGAPEWFKRGIESALMAPTAVNQQRFKFTLRGNVVTARAGRGPYTRIDLGIAKYHFEAAAGKENFVWGK